MGQAQPKRIAIATVNEEQRPHRQDRRRICARVPPHKHLDHIHRKPEHPLLDAAFNGQDDCGNREDVGKGIAQRTIALGEEKNQPKCRDPNENRRAPNRARAPGKARTDNTAGFRRIPVPAPADKP